MVAWLIIEMQIEKSAKKKLNLHVITPRGPSINHRQDPMYSSVRILGITNAAINMSEAAILAIKIFVVFLSALFL